MHLRIEALGRRHDPPIGMAEGDRDRIATAHEDALEEGLHAVLAHGGVHAATVDVAQVLVDLWRRRGELDGAHRLERRHERLPEPRACGRRGRGRASGDAAAQAADVHRRQGRPGSALTAAALAAKLADRSGARTPALAIAARPLPLTGREREIAEMAARGLSNRAIAARLTVSVRTVEGHLYRAGLKLGVSERAALADVLGVE